MPSQPRALSSATSEADLVARFAPRVKAKANLHELLLDVSRATASHRDVSSLIRDLGTILGRIACFDRLALVLHDDERNVMRRHTCTAAQPTIAPVIELPPSETPSGLAWETQAPVVVARV